ncbi:MAG: phosphatase PAP2 family protein [Pseudomonadota bacterium]
MPLPPDPRFLDRCALGALIVLAVWYGLGGYHALFVPINESLRVAPDALLEVITYCGDAVFALMVLLLMQRKPEILWLGLLAALMSTAASNGLKSLFDAARPGTALPLDSFRLVGPLYFSRSFPSGHAITAFTLAGVLSCFATPAVRRSLMTAAFVVAFSRVAVGAHWPVDVLAGAAMGCGCVRLALLLTPQWTFGMRPGVQRLFQLLLCGVAAWSLGEAPVYDAAAWVAWPLAVAAIGYTVLNYLWKPSFNATRKKRTT